MIFFSKSMRLICWTIALLALGLNACASDESLARGLPGEYRRRFTGMFSDTIVLYADGTYLFTFHFDIGSKEQRGKWSIRDGVVTLMLKPGEAKITECEKLRVVVANQDLALMVIDEAQEAPDESDVYRLFISTRKRSQPF